MDSRNREHRNGGTHHHREDILLETNFDEDGALTMAHTQPNNFNNQSNTYFNNNGNALQRNNGRRSFYRSDTSIDRYSEFSLHGRREKGRNVYYAYLQQMSHLAHAINSIKNYFLCVI